MCVIYCAWQLHPEYPLVLLSNRDEFHRRPTQAAHWWQQDEIFAGRDELAGGSWLGADKRGRIAAVTNVRKLPDASNAEVKSRGGLVTDYLQGDDSPLDFMSNLESADQYAGFNLLAGSSESLAWYSNRSDAAGQALQPGIYGLSNAALDTPWPKVLRGKQALEAILQADRFDVQAALAILGDEKVAADEALPDTGVGLNTERMLSPIFINSSHYGTRASTVITVDREGVVRFIERCFAEQGKPLGETTESWVVAS